MEEPCLREPPMRVAGAAEQRRHPLVLPVNTGPFWESLAFAS